MLAIAACGTADSAPWLASQSSSRPVEGGYEGVTASLVRKQLVVVADPDRVDVAGLESELKYVGRMAHDRDAKFPVIDVRVDPACVSEQQLEVADRLLAHRDWHPDADKAVYSHALTAQRSEFVVDVVHKYTDAVEALKERAGEAVAVQ